MSLSFAQLTQPYYPTKSGLVKQFLSEGKADGRRQMAEGKEEKRVQLDRRGFSAGFGITHSFTYFCRGLPFVKVFSFASFVLSPKKEEASLNVAPTRSKI